MFARGVHQKEYFFPKIALRTADSAIKNLVIGSREGPNLNTCSCRGASIYFLHCAGCCESEEADKATKEAAEDG